MIYLFGLLLSVSKVSADVWARFRKFRRSFIITYKGTFSLYIYIYIYMEPPNPRSTSKALYIYIYIYSIDEAEATRKPEPDSQKSKHTKPPRPCTYSRNPFIYRPNNTKARISKIETLNFPVSKRLIAEKPDSAEFQAFCNSPKTLYIKPSARS